MIGDAIAQAMVAAMVAVAVFTALTVLFVIYGLPWLWHFAKPWLHMVTG